MEYSRFSDGGRPQQSQQSRRALRLGTRPTTGYLHSQPKVTPPILQSSKADFGEDFIDSQRRNRLGKANGGRARSEVTEMLSNGGNSRLNASYYHHRREGSYNDDDRRSVHAVRSTSYYDRPRSSFEPTSAAMTTSTPAPRVVRNRQDDWQEVERRNQTQYSSDEDFDDEEVESGEEEELREELEMYNRRGNSAANNSRQQNFYYPKQSRPDFSDDDLYFFGVIQLSPQRARQIVMSNAPPNEFWTLSSVEKAAYLYYYSLYKQYIQPVKKFHNIFNREFYKYTAAGDSDDAALIRICKHTRDEYDTRRQRYNKQAYDRSRQHLFSDDRATPDSRATSYCEQLDESDILSVDSGAKEPHRFTKPHAFVSFAVGGKLLILNPEFSISTIRVEDVKSRIRDRGHRRNIDAMENFKGPLIINETPSHTPLLFIERQIEKILQSEIYRQNSASSDANDVLLIWRLLEMLIRQHGNVTGPDLARLLTTNYSFSSPTIRSTRGKAANLPATRDTESPLYLYTAKDERRVDPRSMDRFTQFLLGGYIDEAIESAINDGLLFDALILAYRMYGNDRQKLESIESKLLAYRDPQHPALTLLSVASQMPVPILSNMSAADDTSGWRAHIAIVLANLNNKTAIYTVHQLGLALSRKEFNAAADFCFLAVNLLTSSYDCFAPVQSQQSDDEEPFRRHITLINASLPDDEYYSTKTRYGWSIIDFQATELYDFALKMSQRSVTGGLSASSEYQKCRLEYAQMLAEYGGAATSAFKYCQSIANCIWENAYQQNPKMLNDLCDLGDQLHCVANQSTEQLTWVVGLRRVADELLNKHYVQQSQQLLPPNMTPGHFQQPLPILNPISPMPIQPVMQPSEIHEENISHNDQPSILPSYDPHQEEQIETSSRRFSLLNDESRKSSIDNSQQRIQQPLTPPFHQIEPKVQDMSSPQKPQPVIQNELQRRTTSPPHMHHPIEIKTADMQPKHPEIQQPSPPQEMFYQPKIQAEPQRVAHEQPIMQPRQTQPSIQSDSSRQSQPQQSPQHSLGNQSNDISKKQPELQQPSPQLSQKKPAVAPTKGSGGGFLSGITKKIAKLVPSGNEMKLPDDSDPNKFRFDESLGRWVGEGVEEVVAPPPPPSIPSSAPTVTMQDVGSVAAGFGSVPIVGNDTTGNLSAPAKASFRRSTGPRYANSFASATTASPSAALSLAPDGFGSPIPPAIPQFYMPSIPDDDNNGDETSNPFSLGSHEPEKSNQ